MFNQKNSLSEEVYKGSVIEDKFIHQILLSNFNEPIHVSYYDDKGHPVSADNKRRVTTIFHLDSGAYNEGRRVDNGSNDIIIEVTYDEYMTELKSKTLAGIVTCHNTLNPLTSVYKLWNHEIVICKALTTTSHSEYIQQVECLTLSLSKLFKNHYEALANMPALDLGN